VATLAYRAAKALRGAPVDFAGYRVSPTSRSPAEILAHMGDLFDWALSMAKGAPAWADSTPLAWEAEVGRFHATLQAFDAYLSSHEPLGKPAEMLFRGPVADALTHTGQLTLLRRTFGAPILGENYAKAHVETGRVGPDQAPPDREFP
jgi:hypothetical protein